VKIYLQKDGKGKKYWVTGVDNNVMLDTLASKAGEFPKATINTTVKKIERLRNANPKMMDYSVYGHESRAKTTKKPVKKAVKKTKTVKKTPRRATSKLKTLGKLHSVVYKSNIDGALLCHDFKVKPDLIATTTKQLAIKSGKYTITDRGISG
jgi:hypothetical protein